MKIVCLDRGGWVGRGIVSLYFCASLVVNLSVSLSVCHAKYELLLGAGVAQSETIALIAHCRSVHVSKYQLNKYRLDLKMNYD